MLHSGPEWAWKRCQWRSALHFQKLRHYNKHIIRLFSLISRILVGGLTPHLRHSCCILQQPPPKPTGQVWLTFSNWAIMLQKKPKTFIVRKVKTQLIKVESADGSKTLDSDLVGFYGISTIVGYLIPNSLYTYIFKIYMICFVCY